MFVGRCLLFGVLLFVCVVRVLLVVGCWLVVGFGDGCLLCCCLLVVVVCCLFVCMFVFSCGLLVFDCSVLLLLVARCWL